MIAYRSTFMLIAVGVGPGLCLNFRKHPASTRLTEGTNRGGGKGASPRLQRHPQSWLWWICGGRRSLDCSLQTFYLQNARFYSGGTRIRTGDTMIFRFVPKPTVNRHRAPWAESKRFLEVTDRRDPPVNAVGRHAVVVGLWWAKRVPEREEDPERWTSLEREK